MSIPREALPSPLAPAPPLFLAHAHALSLPLAPALSPAPAHALSLPLLAPRTQKAKTPRRTIEGFRRASPTENVTFASRRDDSSRLRPALSSSIGYFALC
jgi:hypothetical protein